MIARHLQPPSTIHQNSEGPDPSFCVVLLSLPHGTRLLGTCCHHVTYIRALQGPTLPSVESSPISASWAAGRAMVICSGVLLEAWGWVLGRVHSDRWWGGAHPCLAANQGWLSCLALLSILWQSGKSIGHDGRHAPVSPWSLQTACMSSLLKSEHVL